MTPFASSGSSDHSTDNLYMFACTLYACYHHNFSDLFPLLLRGVCACRIMGTSMQDKDWVLWTTLWETGIWRSNVKPRRPKCSNEWTVCCHTVLTSKSPRKPAKSRPLFSASQYLYGRTSSKPALLNTALWFSEKNSKKNSKGSVRFLSLLSLDKRVNNAFLNTPHIRPDNTAKLTDNMQL